METPGEEPRAEAGPGSARRNAASARGCKSLCAPAGRDRRGQSREARAGYQFTGSCAANQPRLCAATVKPTGADGPGFVSAEAKLFPTPELPPPPQSAQPLRAREPSRDCHRRRPRASPARGRGCPDFRRVPSGPRTHLSPLLLPPPENQAPAFKPTPERRSPGPPRTRKSAQRGASGRSPAQPAGRPLAASCPLGAPRHRGLRGERVCLRFPLSELILTRSSCVPELL